MTEETLVDDTVNASLMSSPRGFVGNGTDGIFEEFWDDAALQEIGSSYDCVSGSVLHVGNAARYIRLLKGTNQFDETVHKEFLSSEAAFGISDYDFDGIDVFFTPPIAMDHFMRETQLNLIASHIMITHPREEIQKYSIRIHGMHAKGRSLKNLPEDVKTALVGKKSASFGTSKHRNRLMSDRMKITKELFNSLQKALRDIRSYSYDYDGINSAFRWHPSDVT
ncbi:hypothetical protein Aduo_015735 [Ancylostoma duodenale]